ncbi:MAG: DUF1559 domain-containing protein [Gemmataceae bacterium]|nr:DUF1559 domain-containing protein [Gemmataceae bacterium]
MSSSRRQKRPAFTLIELLVVIAIIAILIGLLLPAVQKVREAAARAQCQNHLKQLGLAVHAYHDVYKFLPRNRNPNTLGYDRIGRAYSWFTQILPFLEQGALYTQGQFGSATPPTLDANAAVVSKSIAVLFCPADDADGQSPSSNRADVRGLPLGLTNYRGVSGSNWAWGKFPNNTAFGNNGLDAGNGIFYRADGTNKLTLASITDGTSNTFLAGEDVPRLNIFCDWVHANHANGTCAIPPNTAILPQYTGTGYAPGDWQNVYSFRSRHTGGLQFANADGSVRFVSDSISLTTYRALATIRGNEIPGNDAP